MTAYYNELDPGAAGWLRELIKAGVIADGYVDERDIRNVRASELAGYTQCHFFAGIGVWSYALRLAGWSDDRPVWTGSCPCQPFSLAGRRLGTSDERHLWPVWRDLIREHRPSTIFGEQVASKAAIHWLAAVQDDLEGGRYSFAAFDLPAASVGAPHIRQRIVFVADADHERRAKHALLRQEQEDHSEAAGRGEARRMADCGGTRLEIVGKQQARPQRSAAERSGEAGILGDAGSERGRRNAGAISGAEVSAQRSVRSLPHEPEPASAARNFWSDAEWLYCRDGKARPVEPGSFPLAHGAPGRVGRLRGYGNAIVATLAAEFIRAYMSI